MHGISDLYIAVRDMAAWKQYAIAAAIFVIAIVLTGCRSRIEYVPVAVKGDAPQVAPGLVAPAKRPPARDPANTPVLDAGRQWAADRRGWGDEADRSDAKSRFICRLYGGKYKDKKTARSCRAVLENKRSTFVGW